MDDDKRANINFERAAMLLHIIESAAKHGSAYQPISDAAAKELKEMIGQTNTRPVFVTTNKGPNTAIQHPDGRIEEIQKSTVAGERKPLENPGQIEPGVEAVDHRHKLHPVTDDSHTESEALLDRPIDNVGAEPERRV